MAEYIEREALMKNFCGYDLTKCVKYGNESAEQQHDSYSTMMMYEIADEIEDAPAADVARVRHGRWFDTGAENETGNIYFCSVCNKFYNPNKKDAAMKRAKEKPDYCPNCGAKMDMDLT